MNFITLAIIAGVIIMGVTAMPVLGYTKAVRINHDRYQWAIIAASHAYQIPTYALERIALIESKFEPSARGTSGEYGMFQIMPGNVSSYFGFQVWTVDQALDVNTNAMMAAWILRGNLDHFNEDLETAVRAYNVGYSTRMLTSKTADNYWRKFDSAKRYFPA